MQEKTAGGTPAAPIKLDVSVRVIEPVKNLMGFASVKFNDCFVVENLKIVQGSKGLFLGMPSQPDGKGAVPFKRVPGVEVCAACHGLAIDKMTALYGKRDDCSTCHPYHARPMHGKVYENRQATTKTVLE